MNKEVEKTPAPERRLTTVISSIGRQPFVDFAALRAAATWKGRLQAVSWPKTLLTCSVLVFAAATVFFMLRTDEVRAYPPPLPSEQTLRIRASSLEKFDATPPQALIAANRSTNTRPAS